MIGLISRPVIYGLLAALLATGLWGGWQSIQRNRAEAAEVKAEDRQRAAEEAHATFRAEVDASAKRQDAENRATEQRHAADMARIAAEYDRERQNAEAAASRVVADLRNGNVRLRNQWAGCSRSLPEAAEGSGEADGADGLRQDSAGRIIGAVTACQAQRDALIEVIESERR